MTKGRRVKTYPESRGPWDGPTDVVPGSDADGMDSREHYGNGQVEGEEDGKLEVGGGGVRLSFFRHPIPF